MAICPRGFMMIRNMRTGEVRPFFIKVREQDIIWKDQAVTRDDIVVNEMSDDGWNYETHTLNNRVQMYKVVELTSLTYVSTRKATVTITLPVNVNASTSGSFFTKNSADNTVLENALVEGRFINADETGLSNTLQITFISINGEFTSSNVTNLSGSLNILIHGFSI